MACIPCRHGGVDPIAGLAQLGLTGAGGGERLSRADPEGVAGDAAGHASGRAARCFTISRMAGRGEACRRRMVAPPNAVEQCAGIVPGAIEVSGDPGDGGRAEIADVAAPLLIGLAAEHRQGAGAIGHARDVGHVDGGVGGTHYVIVTSQTIWGNWVTGPPCSASSDLLRGFLR